MRQALLGILIFVLAVPSFAGDAGEGTAPGKLRCAVCGMFVAPYADWNAKITFSDGTSAVFDGAKDLFKYYLDITRYAPARRNDTITAIAVKDYTSKQDTDARTAYYVIWSDVYGPMGHEPIAFARESDARGFQKEHHGRKVLRFDEISLKLLSELDNP